MKCTYVCVRVCVYVRMHIRTQMYVRTYVCMGVPKSKNLYLKLILDSYEYIPVAYETMYCMI